MSITNEKLQTIKDNVSKVYHSGQMDVIKNATSLKGFENGRAILLDDVSPVEHEMEVKVHGKNLLSNLNYILPANISTEIGYSEKIYLKAGLSYTFSIASISGATSWRFIAHIYENGTMISSTDSRLYSTDWFTGDINMYCSNGNYFMGQYNITTLENIIYKITPLKDFEICFGLYFGDTSTETICNNVQIELGSSATTYEPYNSDIQNVYSKNLLPFPYTGLKNVGVTEELNGVKFTLNEDGSVLIDGTAETGTVKYVYQNTKGLLGLISGDVITGSKYVSDNSQLSNFNLTFNYYDSTTTMKAGISLGSASTGTTTITDDYVGWGIYFYIPSGKTISNLLVKPQLEIGSTATYYEKYHEPYPLVVKELGKNLFNVNDYTSDYQYKDGIFSGNNKSSYKEYLGIGITDIWKIAYNSNLPITFSFDLKSEIDGEIRFYTLGEYRISFTSSGEVLMLTTTTDWQHFDITSTRVGFTTGTGGDVCNLSFYGVYDSGVIPSVKNLQIYLGDTIISEYEDYVTPKEYIPTTDGVIDGVTNLYPNTTLISNGDRVYIDCNYYKDIDKAYNKLSASIALSEGE